MPQALPLNFPDVLEGVDVLVDGVASSRDLFG